MSISKDCPSKFTTLQNSLFSHRIKWPDFTHIQHLVSEELCQVLRTSLCFCRTYKTETDDKEMHNQMRSLWRKQITILIKKIALKSPGEVQRMGNLGNSRGNPTLSKGQKRRCQRLEVGDPALRQGCEMRWAQLYASLKERRAQKASLHPQPPATQEQHAPSSVRPCSSDLITLGRVTVLLYHAVFI